MRLAFLWVGALAFVSPVHAAEVIHSESAPAPARIEPKLANPLAVVNLADLAATRERPLFSLTRRPAHVESPPAASPLPQVAEEAAAPTTPPFVLLGAVVGEDASFVLLRNRETNEVSRLSPGDQNDGWKVATIGPRSVMLEREGRIENLALANPAAAGAQPAAQVAKAAPNMSLTAPTPSPQDSPALAEYDRLMRKLNLH